MDYTALTIACLLIASATTLPFAHATAEGEVELPGGSGAAWDLNVYVLRVDHVTAAADGGFQGFLSLALGSLAPVVIPVNVPKGGTISGSAAFQHAPGDISMEAVLRTSSNGTAIIVSGKMLNGTLHLDHHAANATLVSLDPAQASIVLSGGPVSGSIRIHADYTTWEGRRKIQMAVLPVEIHAESGLLPQIQGGDAPPALESGLEYTTFEGEGPVLDVDYPIERGPIALRYSVVFLDAEERPILTMRGIFLWQDGSGQNIVYATAPSANQTLRSVSFSPMRTSEIARLAISNALLLNVVAPTHERADLDPSRDIHVVCESTCAAPLPPWHVKLERALAWAEEHIALLLAGTGALVITSLVAVGSRSSRSRGAELEDE